MTKEPKISNLKMNAWPVAPENRDFSFVKN